MQFSFWSFVLFGLFVAVNVDARDSNRKYNGLQNLTEKSKLHDFVLEVMEFYEQDARQPTTADVEIVKGNALQKGSEGPVEAPEDRKYIVRELLVDLKQETKLLRDHRNNPLWTKFPYLTDVVDRLLSEVTQATDRIDARIQESPAIISEREFESLKKEIARLETKLLNNRKMMSAEQGKFRLLVLAVRQMLKSKHDSRLPPGSELVQRVHDFIQAEKEQTYPDQAPLWSLPVPRVQLAHYVARFMSGPNSTYVSDEQLQEIGYDTLVEQLMVLNEKTERAREEALTLLPLNSAERINRAILLLVEYNRKNQRLHDYSVPAEEPVGLENILLPIFKTLTVPTKTETLSY